MVLSDLDRNLLRRCLAHEQGAWEDLIDRFLGLVLHVIDHTAEGRGIRALDADRDDIASDVFMALIDRDYAVLRRFRGQSSLATYLTVIARRVSLRQLLKRTAQAATTVRLDERFDDASHPHWDSASSRDREQIEHLMQQLSHDEAEVVRMYHLEGQSYHEISRRIGMPENSVGPTLSRARTKMKLSEET